VFLNPRVVGKPGHKGGAVAWPRVMEELVGLIKQEPTSLVTTMFDFYALPPSWPGKQQVAQLGLHGRKAITAIESAVAQAVQAATSTVSTPLRFLPYLSLHEFEALLFSAPQVLAESLGVPTQAEHFAAVVAGCGGCENIDEGPTTAPSKRIVAVAPSYQKVADGVIVAERTGLGTMRAQCPAFDGWLTKLEAA
jgi:hypothetical protein